MEEKELEGKYSSICITDLEKKIDSLKTVSRESQKEMYECLEYLRMSNRYKENATYKTASFWKYLDDRFGVREGTYRDHLRVYSKFNEYAVQYGIGLIAKIDRICGGMAVEKVVSEIQKETESRKTPIPRAKIESIIQRFEKKPRREKKEKPDWKTLYMTEKRAHDATKIALKTAMERIKELNEQIAKLKVTASKVSKIKKIFSEPVRHVASV